MDAPKAFKTFEVSDGFIRLHLHDRTCGVRLIFKSEKGNFNSLLSIKHTHYIWSSNDALSPGRVRLVVYHGNRRDYVLYFMH